jgi:hypothetical protein
LRAKAPKKFEKYFSKNLSVQNKIDPFLDPFLDPFFDPFLTPLIYIEQIIKPFDHLERGSRACELASKQRRSLRSRTESCAEG